MKLGTKHVYGLIKATQTKIIYFLQLLIKKKKKSQFFKVSKGLPGRP